MANEAEPDLYVIDHPVCGPCLRAEGEECHTPECSFYLMHPPGKHGLTLWEKWHDVPGVLTPIRAKGAI